MVHETPPGRPSTPSAANLGLARPPIIYSTAILLGLLLRLLWPVRLVPGLARPFGAQLTVLAVALFLWSVRTFRLAGTPVPGNRPTTVIVKTGPYRFSRNPIYLAFSLFQAGVALATNDAWVLATLIPAISVMSFVVVPREERYLRARFGEDYAIYKGTVRRWL